jgi:hypothetical protein
MRRLSWIGCGRSRSPRRRVSKTFGLTFWWAMACSTSSAPSSCAALKTQRTSPARLKAHTHVHVCAEPTRIQRTHPHTHAHPHTHSRAAACRYVIASARKRWCRRANKRTHQRERRKQTNKETNKRANAARAAPMGSQRLFRRSPGLCHRPGGDVPSARRGCAIGPAGMRETTRSSLDRYLT